MHDDDPLFSLTATSGQAAVTSNIQDQTARKLVNIEHFWAPMTAAVGAIKSTGNSMRHGSVGL
jgi:hypothetical protein